MKVKTSKIVAVFEKVIVIAMITILIMNSIAAIQYSKNQ